jgi:hypothetical protein
MYERVLRSRRAAGRFNFAMFAALVVSAVAARSGWPQSAEKLPTARQVLDRNVKATGGAAALLRYKSMTVHGRLTIPAKNLTLETADYTKGGDKVLQRVILPDGTENRSGFDGATAWDLDKSGNASIATGDIIKTTARDADMYYHLHVMKYFRSMQVVGVKNFNGRPCYHLKGVNNWGKTNEQFYDKETGLLLGYRFNTAWRGGNGDASQTFEDYKDFGGVLMPAKTTSRDGNDVFISTVTSVTYDDVADSVFALPEAVRKEKAKGGT